MIPSACPPDFDCIEKSYSVPELEAPKGSRRTVCSVSMSAENVGLISDN